MNILTDELPESVELSGGPALVHADHRSCIRAIVALLDDEKDGDMAVQEALRVFYQDYSSWVYRPEEALMAEVEFLRGVPVQMLPGQTGNDGGYTERAYSFLYDQEAIYAAFWQQYHIDLSRETLHWWRFKALLNNLHGNHMSEIMYKRTAQEHDGMSSEQKKQLRREKMRWRLPALSQETKQADDIAQALIAGDVRRLEEALGRG